MDVTDEIELGSRLLAITHPPDATELIDEDAFEREEFLPYWAELWPSSIALARAVTALPLAGLAVVELGCGLALPSIAAALGGARVLATDWSSEALAYAERNARDNGAELETARVAWANPDALVARAPFDLVLAADVLYEARNAAQLQRAAPAARRRGAARRSGPAGAAGIPRRRRGRLARRAGSRGGAEARGPVSPDAARRLRA